MKKFFEHRKFAFALFLLSGFGYYALVYSSYALALYAAPVKVIQWFPVWGKGWLSIRHYTPIFIKLTMLMCGAYLSFPYLISLLYWIKKNRKEVLLATVTACLTLLLAEFFLRITARLVPGQIANQSSFQPVDTLVLDEGYLADSNAMTYIHPAVAKKICTFLQTPYNNKSDIETAYTFARKKWKGMAADFQPLALDYALVRALEDKSPFANRYRTILSQNKKNDFDSLLLAYTASPINADGFRSIAFRKQSNKIRILFIGDSFTYGYTTTNKTHSFYDLLLAKGYEVYNTGLNDSDPAQYEAIAQKYIPLLQPDIVIVNFYLGNDVQYYRQHFEPYQTYNYRTNAGYLQVCPLGVPVKNMQEAYQYALESSFIPTDNVLNWCCSQTVITTLLWNALCSKGLMVTKSKHMLTFEKEAIRRQQDFPDANTRMNAIRKLCETNHSAFILSIIPTLSLTNNKIVYVDAFKNLFPDKQFVEPHHLSINDYCSGTDGHFNEMGHQKYAAFLQETIDVQIQKTNRLPSIKKPY